MHAEAFRAEPNPARGRVLVFPGVFNTRFHLLPFVKAVEQRIGGLDLEVRPWGVPLRPFHNIAAHERNMNTARVVATELARWRLDHPRDPLYLLGYSGGGGFAVLVVASLPGNVVVDRLILVAPAISPTYPLESMVLPHIAEFVVSYASPRDLQVGWATQKVGTIDRAKTKSAGAIGFDSKHPKLLQWHWSKDSRRYGHYGNHLSFLAHDWQAAMLLPALDRAIDARSLAARWTSSVAVS